ncbi:MAG: hypothetical protein IIA92_05630 [Chloroflexi bacterium]|nr:hypothetical protein [Chloroflexota bacterium]
MQHWHKVMVLLILAVLSLACSSGENEARTNEVLSAFYNAVLDSPDLDKTEDVELKEQYLEYWSISLLALGSTERAAGENYRVTFRFDPYDPDTKETWEFDMDSENFRPVDVGALSSATLFFCPSTNLCASYQEMWLQIREKLGN